MKEAREKETLPRLLFGRGYFVDFSLFAHLLRLAREVTNSSSLASRLGVTTAKADGLIYLARGFDLLKRSNIICATYLGDLIALHDPFFEDIGTLWFLHYVVASEPRHLAWNRLVNMIIPHMPSFTLQQFRACLADQEANSIASSTKVHIYQETRVVLDAYLNKSFALLRYLSAEQGSYFVPEHREPIPTLVLGASIARYRDRHHPSDTAVLVSDLISAPNSPGVVFQLSEECLRAALEQLKLYSGVSLESRADLDQVRLTETMSDYMWMERYYACR